MDGSEPESPDGAAIVPRAPRPTKPVNFEDIFETGCSKGARKGGLAWA